ncbi:MAG: hypothetical protein JRH11_03555 [Deltaproteobacteria bacterium]|nr:hypothetical protein [Deltaproteobacteria bacterium]
MAGGRRRRELRAIVRQGRLLARAAGRTPPRVTGERVAVFVHGYMAGGAVFDPLRARVERELGISTIDFSYGPLGSFDAVLTRFAAHVEAALPEGVQVSLVGHSLGGILARAFLHEHPGGIAVDQLLTIATPHAGTRAVRFLPVGPATALKPGSAVLSSLEEHRGKRPDVTRVALIAGADALCSPVASAGELPGAEVHHVDGVGHNEVIFDERVHDLVTHHLGRPLRRR